MTIDLVIRLREARRRAGLSQKETAKRSGVGEKTISSFESGQRITSMKVEQLHKLLRAYNLTHEEFFSDEYAQRLLEAHAKAETPALSRLIAAIAELPEERRERLVYSFMGMVDLAKQSERRVGRMG
jgi:transcriptional regulator with XRE-family HTH domain